MAIDWKHELIEQLDWHWRAAARPRLDGLTDDEYLWEPVAGCWSIRSRAEATTTMARGVGDLVLDFEHPAPMPAPVTTIAWRLGHVAVSCFAIRAANHFGTGGVDNATLDWPAGAAAMLGLLDESYETWMAGVRSLDESGLARPCGPAEGPFAEVPLAGLVLHLNREAIHHLAEVALLRDLYRARMHWRA